MFMNVLPDFLMLSIPLWLILSVLIGSLSLYWAGQWLNIRTRSYPYTLFVYAAYFISMLILLVLSWIALGFSGIHSESFIYLPILLPMIISFLLLSLIYKKAFSITYRRSLFLNLVTALINAFILSPFLIFILAYKLILFLCRHQPRPIYRVAIAVGLINFFSLIFIIGLIVLLPEHLLMAHPFVNIFTMLGMNLLLAVIILKIILEMSWWKALLTHIGNLILSAIIIALLAGILDAIVSQKTVDSWVSHTERHYSVNQVIISKNVSSTTVTQTSDKDY